MKINRRQVTHWSIAVFLIFLVSPTVARAQGTPDIVWQGQHDGFVRYTTFSQDGQLLISGSDDLTNKVWQAATGAPIRTIAQCSGLGCRGSEFGFISPDNQTLVTAGVRFFGLATGSLKRRLVAGGNIAISPNWKQVATSVTNERYSIERRRFALLRASDGAVLWSRRGLGGGPVLFAPDGNSVAAVGFEGIDIFRVTDGALLRNIPGPRTLRAFTPDGKFVVTSGGAGGAFAYDDTIKLYRVSDGALTATMSGTGVVTSAAITPDGETLITSSWDVNEDPTSGFIDSTGSIRVWRLADGALLKTYDHMTSIFAGSVAISPDGKLFSYSADSGIAVARVPSVACTFSVSPEGAHLPAIGGSGTISVTGAAGCDWNAVSRVDWLQITSGHAGTGDGTVTFQTKEARNDLTGLLVVAEQTVPVHLGRPTCSYRVLTAEGTDFSIDGGTGGLGVVSASGCGWGAVSNADWITIKRIGADSGRGGIRYSVAPSKNGARSGTITIAGHNVEIKQLDQPCNPTVNWDTWTSFPADGGQGGGTITALHGCPWSVTTDVNWIIVSTAEGDGNSPVIYDVTSNRGSTTRTGHVMLGGQSTTVTQAGRP